MSEYEAKADNVVKNPQLGPRAFESFRALAPDEVLAALNDAKLEALFHQVRGLRLTGKVATSVARRLLEKLAEYPRDVIEESVATYLEQHRSKDERYLIGIARGESKRLAREQRPDYHRRPGDMDESKPEEPKLVGPSHLRRVLAWLRQRYAEGEWTAQQLEAIGRCGVDLQVLTESFEEGEIGASEVDRRAEEIQKAAQEILGDEVVPFSPYAPPLPLQEASKIWGATIIEEVEVR